MRSDDAAVAEVLELSRAEAEAPAEHLVGGKAPERARADHRGGQFPFAKVSFRVRRADPRRTIMSELVSRVWT